MAGPDGPSHQRTPASLVVRLVGLGTTRGFLVASRVANYARSPVSAAVAVIRCASARSKQWLSKKS
jgi:hypothetical protein